MRVEVPERPGGVRERDTTGDVRAHIDSPGPDQLQCFREVFRWIEVTGGRDRAFTAHGEWGYAELHLMRGKKNINAPGSKAG
jgi:hypothetical protein